MGETAAPCRMGTNKDSGIDYIPRGAWAVLLIAFALWCPGLVRAQDEAFEAAFRKGTAAMRQGRLVDAAAAFADCASRRPDFAEAFFNLGLVRLQQKRFEDAIKALEQSVKLKPRLRGAHLFLGMARYRTNEYPAALAALRREVEIDPSSANAYMWLGVVQLAQGNAAGAVADLDKAAELSPNDVDVLYHRGRAHMLLSREIYEHMYQVSPNSWRVHEVLAQAFKEADRLEDAVKECQEAIKLKPDEPGLHEELANIYWKQNHLEQAETEFESELKIDPQNVDSMYKLGALRIERSKPADAARLLTEVLRHRPDSAEAHYQLGRAQAQLGENEPAVKNFAAVVAEPGKADSDTLKQSYYQLAQLYRRLGRSEESRAALNSFIKLKQQADAQRQQKLQDKLNRPQQPQM